jgi:hypothetical protein
MLTCRGLTTSPIPYGGESFQIDFDFIAHTLTPRTSKGEVETMALGPRSVADFYAEIMGRLRGLGLETRIWTMPVEIPDAVPFEQDTSTRPTTRNTSPASGGSWCRRTGSSPVSGDRSR